MRRLWTTYTENKMKRTSEATRPRNLPLTVSSDRKGTNNDDEDDDVDNNIREIKAKWDSYKFSNTLHEFGCINIFKYFLNYFLCWS